MTYQEFESDELSQRLSNGEKPSSNQRTQLEGRIKLRRSNQLLTAVSCHRSSVSTSFDAAIYGDNFDEVPVSADFYPYAAKVIHDYDAQDSDELSLVRGKFDLLTASMSAEGKCHVRSTESRIVVNSTFL